jgi:hypothetical protein
MKNFQNAGLLFFQHFFPLLTFFSCPPGMFLRSPLDVQNREKAVSLAGFSLGSRRKDLWFLLPGRIETKA